MVLNDISINSFFILILGLSLNIMHLIYFSLNLGLSLFISSQNYSTII